MPTRGVPRCSSRELQRLESLSRAPVFSHFSDTLTGLVTIRSFRVQPQFITELCDKVTGRMRMVMIHVVMFQVDTNTVASVVLQSGARWLGLTLDMIGAVIVFTSVLAAILMDQTNPASLGLLISYRSTISSHTHIRNGLVKSTSNLYSSYRLISNLFSLLIPIYLAWVVKFVADIENYMNAVERVLEYTELEAEEDLKRYPQAPDSGYTRGHITFHGVYLGYNLDTRVVIGTHSGV